MYGEPSRVTRFDLTREFFLMKMEAGSSVGDHVLKMIHLIDEMAAIGFIVDQQLSIEIILQSLTPSFGPFMSNFNMNKIDTTLP